jgi:hypothetical protein
LSSGTEDERGRRRALGLLVAALAACQPTVRPEPATSARIVRASPAEAEARAAALLRALGFTVTELASAAVPTVRGELASGVDPAWAHCPGIWTTDPFSDLGQSRFVQAAGRRAVVLVRASALPQGTSVEVDLRTIGLYPHAFTGDTVEAVCDSTGLLERRILDAAQSPP